VEECGVGAGGFACESGFGASVDEVDVEPAVVVIVEERDSGACGFEDEVFVWRSHGVVPGGEACLGCDVFEDDGTGFDRAARGDGAVGFIVDWGEDAAGSRATFGGRLGTFLGVFFL